MNAALFLSRDVGKKAACNAFDISRATFYKRTAPKSPKSSETKHSSPLSLSSEERKTVVDILHSERFCDQAPHQVYATLLDEGQYHCSIRTMYRILKAEHGSVRERRKHVKRTHYKKPELCAEKPNELWTWDISVLQQRTHQAETV